MWTHVCQVPNTKVPPCVHIGGTVRQAMATKSRHLKTPTQLWIADNRKRLGLSSLDLATLTGVSEDTARGWESRGRPSEDALVILERRFGVPRPDDDGQSVGVNADLVAAMDRQTAAIERQTAVMEALLSRLAGLQVPDPAMEREAHTAVERTNETLPHLLPDPTPGGR
jgi:transcriptional regulator with XRE-family HTH domain